MSPIDKGPVANTDQELMAAAFTDEEQDFDNTDRSLEEMGNGPEGQHLDDEAEEVAEPEGDPKKPAVEEPPSEPGEELEEPEEPEEPEEEPRDARGLRAAMLSERKQRQAAEAAAKTMREEIAAERARFDRLLSTQQQPQQQPEPQPAPAKPDPVLDPDGYERYIVAQMEQRYTMRRIEETFQQAHDAHGKEFEAAYESLRKLDHNNPVDRAIGNRLYTSPDPGKAVMKWHREQTILREIGNDPAAYRERQREEFLNDPDMVKAVLARMREQRDGGPQGAPRNVTRLPPSLNRARGGSSANEILGAADNTDSAIFDYAMNGGG